MEARARKHGLDLLTGDGMRSFWSGIPNVECLNLFSPNTGVHDRFITEAETLRESIREESKSFNELYDSLRDHLGKDLISRAPMKSVMKPSKSQRNRD